MLYTVTHPGFARPHLFRYKRNAVKFANQYPRATVYRIGTHGHLTEVRP